MKFAKRKWLVGGVLAALLLAATPIWLAARERISRELSVNRLRQIALAIHTYHDGRNTLFNGPRFPTNICDAQGRPLLSWRVRIAKQLSQDTSLDGLRLDESWDSEHNKQFIERMPEVLGSPERPNDGRTTFLAPLGPGTLLGDPSISERPLRDSTSSRVLVVEADADRAIPWTCPDDLPFDRTQPTAGLGNDRGGAFFAAFADAEVKLVPLTTDPQEMRLMFEGYDRSRQSP